MVQLGDVNGLIVQHKLRTALADATGRYMPSFDKNWPSIAQGLLDAVETLDRGEDATLAGTLTEYLRSYINERPPHAKIEEADEGREPFTVDGSIHIFADNLRAWLQMRRNEKISQNKLTANLRSFGAVPRKFDVGTNGARTSRSAWWLPPGPWDTAASGIS